jgi:hypothetical protein
MTFMYLATEDVLSEALGLKMIKTELGDRYVVTLRENGAGYLKKSMRKFVELAEREFVVVLTDQDDAACAPGMKANWFGSLKQPRKLIFRIAVREAESWLMADRASFSNFLGVSEAIVPRDPEGLLDPKAALINLARKGRRQLRQELAPAKGVQAKQGIGYNEVLRGFVETSWDCRRASENSASLRQACQRLADASHHFAS